MSQSAALQDNLELARRLVDAIESGDNVVTNDLIGALNDARFEVLFQEIGKLTRELHDTFGALVADEHLASLARECMPDARARLHYVIEKTEDAAQRTLTAVETMIPLSDQFVADAGELRLAFVAEPGTSSLQQRTLAFLDGVSIYGGRLRSGLTEILMAQEYQDLTGQVIKRTIDLVSQVEEKLVGLVSACGVVTQRAGAIPAPVSASVSHGPSTSRQNAVLGRQSEVDELLASLGF